VKRAPSLRSGKRKFLGHRLLLNGKLGISPKSVNRAKEKIRQITSRNRGVHFAQVIVELNLFLVGLARLLPPCGVPGRAYPHGRVDSTEAALLPPQAAQTRQVHLRLTPAVGPVRRFGRPAWAVPEKGPGESPIALRSTEPCRSDGSTLRDSSHLSPNMTRYTIKRNRRIHPSTYGGVGGRGPGAPPTRSPRFKIRQPYSMTSSYATCRSIPLCGTLAAFPWASAVPFYVRMTLK
jgi:hypothetical protein